MLAASGLSCWKRAEAGWNGEWIVMGMMSLRSNRRLPTRLVEVRVSWAAGSCCLRRPGGTFHCPTNTESSDSARIAKHGGCVKREASRGSLEREVGEADAMPSMGLVQAPGDPPSMPSALATSSIHCASTSIDTPAASSSTASSRPRHPSSQALLFVLDLRRGRRTLSATSG